MSRKGKSGNLKTVIFLISKIESTIKDTRTKSRGRVGVGEGGGTGWGGVEGWEENADNCN